MIPDIHVHIFLKREAGKAFTRLFYIKRFRFIVLNATFNNIAVIWWRSGLMVEKMEENVQPVASHRQTLSHNAVSSTPRHWRGSNAQPGYRSRPRLPLFSSKSAFSVCMNWNINLVWTTLPQGNDCHLSKCFCPLSPTIPILHLTEISSLQLRDWDIFYTPQTYLCYHFN